MRLPLFSVIASPGESLRITHPHADTLLETLFEGGQAGSREAESWLLQAPSDPGQYELLLRRTDTGDESRLGLWVTVPRTQMVEEQLNGYRIGNYPPPGNRGGSYAPPAGFIEVTRDNMGALLSPHFSLRQFLCKQQSEYPKYVVVQAKLLLLLEGLLAEVRAAGYEIDTFGIVSGYRTPWYNREIGNVRYSRHVYGDAMDIFVDADGDGRMDDLNGDGSHNPADINLLFRIVEKFMARPENAHLAGGVGRYNKTSRHGGFVHVDTRGYRARW